MWGERVITSYFFLSYLIKSYSETDFLSDQKDFIYNLFYK